MKKSIYSFSPLTETTFFILLSLDKPLHGYGIMEKVKDLSNGRIKLGPGTLYGALSNLLEAGLIEPDDNAGKSRRKVYSITLFGRELIKHEIKRLDANVKTARSIFKKGDH